MADAGTTTKTASDGKQTTSSTRTVGVMCCCIPCCFTTNGNEISRKNMLLFGAIATGLAFLSSIIVVGVIDNQLYVQHHHHSVCFFSLRSSICAYAKFCGGFAIFVGIFFVLLYANRFFGFLKHEFLESQNQLLAEAISASLICFFFLISSFVVSTANTFYSSSDAANAVIVFSFVATVAWGVLGYFGYMYFKTASAGGGSSQSTSQPA